MRWGGMLRAQPPLALKNTNTDWWRVITIVGRGSRIERTGMGG